MTGEDVGRADSPLVFQNGGRCDRVGLLLAHQQNRRLLRDWLTPEYEVTTLEVTDLQQPDRLDDIDLLLSDFGAYRQSADDLVAYKEREPTQFRPILLLVEETPRDPEIWTVVDDIVPVPVEQAVLGARIRGLVARRRLSQEVAEREAEFRTLFETAPDPVLVTDRQGTIERVNAAFAALVGVPAEDCQGRSLGEFDAFDQVAIDAMHAAAFETVDHDHTTLTYRTMDNEIRHAECSANVLPHSDEKPRQIIILRDITDRVHQAQELSRQVDRLDEFGRVLAHELRNPLSIASGWLEQAQETGDTDAFERIETAHDRMRNMISELLALARQGSIVGELSTVSLKQLVLDAWESVETEEATLDLEAAIADTTVTGDVERLKEVFTNLFRNAIEHGGTDVTVTVGVLDHGEEFGVYVADDGPGLSAAAGDRFFEPGFTTSQTGSGFGLAIVKQIVEAHGWTIRATDSAMGGARFEIHDIDQPGSETPGDDEESSKE